MLTRYEKVKAFVTKDGSEIRELMHPNFHGNTHQSIAEATIPVGGRTLLHKHHRTEEIYHVTQGHGIMQLGDDRFSIDCGDSILIKPGTLHNLINDGDEPLKILCCCSPAYQDSDTELAEEKE